jgi:4,5-dihydroxyphthalate decarboxylase
MLITGIDFRDCALYPDSILPLIFGPLGVDESDLLLSGECDALITSITPRAFAEGNPKIRQWFSPLKAAEQDYFRDTGLFPIMHVVAIRKEVAEANPGLPAEVFKMYCFTNPCSIPERQT